MDESITVGAQPPAPPAPLAIEDGSSDDLVVMPKSWAVAPPPPLQVASSLSPFRVSTTTLPCRGVPDTQPPLVGYQPYPE